MENLLDLTHPVETLPVLTTSVTTVETMESETISTISAEDQSADSAKPEGIEEIDTAPQVQPSSKATPSQREEPPPNPLLLDPYEWEHCAITVGYSLLPSQKVSVSVHNHQDEPIIKEFPIEAVPLPEKISNVISALQSIWPDSPVNATVVLLPKPQNAEERPLIAAVRVSTDTPIIQAGVESNLPFPTPIIGMLEELKRLMPERALKNIEKNARSKTAVPSKPAGKSTTPKPTATVSAPAINKNPRQNQMTLF